MSRELTPSANISSDQAMHDHNTETAPPQPRSRNDNTPLTPHRDSKAQPSDTKDDPEADSHMEDEITAALHRSESSSSDEDEDIQEKKDSSSEVSDEDKPEKKSKDEDEDLNDMEKAAHDFLAQQEESSEEEDKTTPIPISRPTATTSTARRTAPASASINTTRIPASTSVASSVSSSPRPLRSTLTPLAVPQTTTTDTRDADDGIPKVWYKCASARPQYHIALDKKGNVRLDPGTKMPLMEWVRDAHGTIESCGLVQQKKLGETMRCIACGSPVMEKPRTPRMVQFIAV
jgi:DNA-directed RNA polymerase subunit RPC12/RpoP